MSGIGAEGAFGAQAVGSSLEDIFAQRLKAAQAQQAAAQAQGDLALRTRSLDQQDAYHKLLLQEKVDRDAGVLADKKSQRALLRFNLTPIGGDVSAPEMQAQTAEGIPQGLFRPKPIMAPAPPDSLAAPGQTQPAAIPGTIANSPQPSGQSFTRGATQPELMKQAEQDRKDASDEEKARHNQEGEDIRRAVADITDKVRQGQLNNQEAMLAIRERLATVAETNAGTKAAKGITLSQGGKSALRAIESAGPLTDQALAMLEKEFPGIEKDPSPYNSVMSKAQSLLHAGKYYAGFGDPSDPRQQIISLLKPIQAGQYTQSSRSYKMVELALQHMGDLSQTPARQHEALKALRGLMPELRQGVIRAEQPIDPSNPLAGSYFDPAKHGAASGGSGAQEIVYDHNGKPIR